MKLDKNLMAEVALLYYNQGLTQQEIAKILNLTRQTVSKLLTVANNEGVVEIKIHNPETTKRELETEFKSKFNVNAIIATASADNDVLRSLSTTQAAINYLTPILLKGNLKIAVSWGRSVQALVKQFPSTATTNNIVFPLFGSTEHEQSYFLPNELSREFANKLDAHVKYAWFPYRPDNASDYELFKRTAYYESMQKFWSGFDIALLGIGNNTAFKLLNPTYKRLDEKGLIVGDIATHFFTKNGEFIYNDDYTLRISVNSLKNAGEKIALAYGNDKVEAIYGALKTGVIDTLITDEYTAKAILAI